MNILVSVWDKTGLVPLLKQLAAQSALKLFATGSTAQFLQDEGFDCIVVSDLTQFPEILDGRVKTLHPKIFGGILAKNTEEHLRTLAEHAIPQFDMVICNLYPFEEKLAQNLNYSDMIEFIDIGGVALIRAAAKNHQRVAVLSSVADYRLLENQSGELTPLLRQKLAARAIRLTSNYDAAIAEYLETNLPSEPVSESVFPDTLTLPLQKIQDLRYGENPQDAGAWYSTQPDNLPFTCLQGKELSYNNLLDVHAAYHLIREFPSSATETTCVIIKHGNPCGVAMAETVEAAYSRAFAADSVSAFGGIIAVNQPATADLAHAVNQQFAEIVIAPSFSVEAVEIFSAKKNLRLIEFPRFDGQADNSLRFRDLSPIGVLLEKPLDAEADTDFELVTQTPLPERLKLQTRFAWSVVKHLRSNAIVVANDGVTLGMGMGQTSRIASTLHALEQAGARAEGAVLASDGFFPATDNIEAMAKAGIAVVVQPGGSIKDKDVIAAADAHGIAMLLTHKRCFKH